ncbi:hypothetical protein PC129_g6082 [Phytophthora cactorum]|uniref:Uncharacterized protein n=2 Tax=Phytophthora cactorum TaxID=29920 RepID=A0A8T1IFB9_9STRA|nr:hypothetical protein PC129_g6082 [Phytophthora cactorum]
MFPQFLSKQRTSVNVQDTEDLSLVELLEANVDQTSQQESQNSLSRPSLPGAQAYVNRLLVRVKQNANLQKIRLTPGLTSHSFRRGGAMHTNNGTVAQNWIIERGGWLLDRVNKAFGYMPETTQADQQVSRVLSDQSLNLDEGVADVLVATLFLHYPDMLHFCDSSPFVVKIREAMVVQSIGESEVLAWSSTIRREFIPASQPSTSPSDDSDRLGIVLKLVQRQTEQISVLILQNKQLEERLLAAEDKLHTPSGTTT